jgi:2-polyprenyl-3-methyl-5-hydroxy-6-metoxy-1,4-benzoquinol methylase
LRKKKSKQKKEKAIIRFPVPPDRSLVYQRDLDPEGEDSLARLLRRIPERGRVLELGPATGYCTRYLHEALGCTVDAVELSAEMAEQARPWCRRLVVGDIETLDLDQAFSGEAYDVILCADVLEHLRDPWSLCARLADRLGPEGRLLLSVPNVGYLGLLVDLLRGNFRYRDEGLLDRTHLRFFTFDSLRELLEHTGWHIWSAEQVILSLTDSEFRVRLESLSPALRDELLTRSDALCYQWVVEARRIPPPHPVTLAAVPPEDRFQVRVFWRDEEAHFDYSRNRLCWAALGRERQTVVLEVPAGQRALALRLSDRVSFVRLHRLRLVADSDVPLWDWTPEQGPLPLADAVGMEACEDDGLWFVADTESRLILDLPIATVAAARKVVVELGTPISGDYLAAKA